MERDCMQDRLQQLLDEHDHLFGVICRDATVVQLELLALAGYHVVYLDLEHGSQSNAEAVQLARTIIHLGMVPLVRIPELSRTHVQVLLDGGVEILTLPNVRTAQQAADFVQLGKYPPLGERGLCSSSANFNYQLRDPEQELPALNKATRLSVMIESDQGYEALDSILDVEGIDIVTVGAADWGAASGLYGAAAKAQLGPKVEHVLTAAAKAGRMTSLGVFDSSNLDRYCDLGVRIFFVGVDVNLKRDVLADTLDRFRNVAENG